MLTLDLKAELDRTGVEYEVLDHPRTLTAAAEAEAVGVPAEDVGKTIVLTSGERYIRAALSASDRLDMHKVRNVVEGARLATEEELAAAYPMFELGAVPPLGGPAGDRVLVDQRLAAREKVVVEAGTHDKSLRLRTSDLLSVTAAEIVDLAE